MSQQRRIHRALATAVLVASLSHVTTTAFAYTWKSTPENNEWNLTSDNWTPSPWLNGMSNLAWFSTPSPNQTITITDASPVQAAIVIFTTGGWTITGGAIQGSIRFQTETGVNTIESPITGDPSSSYFLQTGPGTLVVTNTITGSLTRVSNVGGGRGGTLRFSPTASSPDAQLDMFHDSTIILDSAPSSATFVRGKYLYTTGNTRVVVNGSAGFDTTDSVGSFFADAPGYGGGSTTLTINAAPTHTTTLLFSSYNFNLNTYNLDLVIEGQNVGQVFTGQAEGVSRVRSTIAPSAGFFTGAAGVTPVMGAVLIRDTVSGKNDLAAYDATTGFRPLREDNAADYAINTFATGANVLLKADANVSANTPINSLTFRNAGTPITLSGSGTLTFPTSAVSQFTSANPIVSDGTAENFINGPMIISAPAADGLIVHAIADITIGATINAASLTKANLGTLTLTAANSFSLTSAAVDINAGVLSISADNNLGVSANKVAMNGGTLRITESITFTHPIVALNGVLVQNIVQVAAGKTVTFTGAFSITGNGPGLAFAGPGTSIINTPKSISTIGVVSGTLQIATNSPLGSSGTIRIGDTTGSQDASLLTTGPFTVPSAITFQNGSTNNTLTVGGATADTSTFSGQINLGPGSAYTSGTPGRDAKFVAAPGGTVIFSGLITKGSGATAANLTIGDALNTGVVKITGNNAYTGNTILNAGTLLLTNSAGSATGTGNTLLNGGTLGGSGIITGAVLPGAASHTIAPSATLPTTAATLLTLGQLSTNNFTTLSFNLITPNTNDALNITATNALTLNGGNIQVANAPDTPASLGYYKIIQYAGAIGGAGIASLTLPATANNIAYTLDTVTNPNFITLHKGYLGDANDDGTVNFSDFVLLSNNFGQPNQGWSGADFNNDNITNFADFVLLSNHFGESIAGSGFTATPDELAAMQAFATTPVPEPATLVLLSLALPLLTLALPLLTRRQRNRN